MRTLRGDRQTGVESYRGSIAQLCIRLHDLLGYQPAGPVGKGMHNTRNIRKGFDTFSALGPWIVTRDEIDEPQNLSINVLQNGKEVMTAHTSDMICGLREHIRFLTSCLTLRPGDLITTG